MATNALPRGIVRFGSFEVDLAAGELRKNGLRVRLQDQPFRVLTLLLERPGEVVSRDDIREKLWSADTFVEFEHSLNTAVNRLRAALGDSAEHPHYVETLPRRGYRFIAPVDTAENQLAALAMRSPNNDGIAGSQLAVPATAAPITAAVPPSASIWATANGRYILPWFLFGITGMALLGFLYVRETPQEVPLRKFSITPPVPILVSERPRMVTISPNGKHIAFAEGTAEGKLWVQDLDESEPRAIDHTEGARGPFWSPDSRFIGFGTGSEIKKVPLEGGQVSPLCTLPATGSFKYNGASWSPDGETVVFSSLGVIYEVPAAGGIAKPLISAETQLASADGLWGFVRSPHFLPSERGRKLLVFGFGAISPRQSLMIQDLDSGQRVTLGPGARPVYSPTGHLVYEPNTQSRTLMALPFSLKTLTAIGKAFPIAHDGHYPSIAQDGTLAYLERPAVREEHLVWVDRRGRKLAAIGPVQRSFRDPDLSPNGQRVAVSIGTERGQDIWVYDLDRGSGAPVTTVLESDHSPSWSPEGDYVAFTSNRAGNGDLYLRRADGTGDEDRLLGSTPSHGVLSDWSWDGKYLLFDRHAGEQGEMDIWYLKRNENDIGWEEPHRLTEIPGYERVPKLSPNTRYVAYVSDLSGELEVYVESFPEGGGRERISKNGGTQPRWSAEGKELFYVEGDTLMAVSFTTTPTFSVGETTTLFSHTTLNDHTPYPQYDVSNDGQRFILDEPVGEPPRPKIRVVQNWFAEFQDRE